MHLVWLVVFNSLIATGFWTRAPHDPILPYFVLGNGIGFSAYLIGGLANRIAGRRIPIVLRVLIVGPLAVVIGVELAARTVGHVPSLLQHASLATWLYYAPTFLVAGVAIVMFSLFVQSAQMRAALETERREAAELRQSETAARLALLQAQIEPHFLFNTLANVQSLIERDPARASAMLDSLNRYLRASLGRTRKPVSLLGEELELVDALLHIASMRLGDRLRYRIAVPGALRQLALPPLLLQPLVENALLHGIEPAIDGGEILVRARRDGEMLELSVIDTGMGLGHGKGLHGGVGLSNVRARLNSLYGEAGSLTVVGNTGAHGGALLDAAPDAGGASSDADATAAGRGAASAGTGGMMATNAARGVTATLRIPIR
ncbi:sensor histidine kinase [Trinickia terrae]|nr:histidine kinase [Trinickia terrae]